MSSAFFLWSGRVSFHHESLYRSGGHFVRPCSGPLSSPGKSSSQRQAVKSLGGLCELAAAWSQPGLLLPHVLYAGLKTEAKTFVLCTRTIHRCYKQRSFHVTSYVFFLPSSCLYFWGLLSPYPHTLPQRDQLRLEAKGK